MKKVIKILFYSLFMSFFFSSCMEEGLRGPAGIIGDPGEKGPVGDKGDDGRGNVNVLKYTFNIEIADWVETDLGDGNIVMSYIIPETSTGNISLKDENYLVYAYAQPGYSSYPQRKILPYVYGVNNNYGIRIELLLGDNTDGSNAMIAMSKAINGFGNGALTEDEMPPSVAIDIFLIKMTDLDDSQASASYDYEVLNSLRSN
ncbi:collagen-like protein [Dysgonomonas sp. Marseille-P4677]|uniref:collagen-like triple helix repeat-containing protein n=1 Tax=Dysgonomonas sp. Marseille-P4677 TaxID=2364790 RepID=UPI0019129856|nr:collagen-like protein [Dysgonomonas sp. Marseille-P4677]MBK5719857.1 collagen-like protein [Dysgonomonas sp. Marseille-P4677]